MFELAANNSAVRIAFLLAIFSVVVLLTIGMVTVISRRNALRTQLQRLETSPDGAIASASLRAQANDSAWARMAQGIEARGLSLADTDNDKLTKKLKAAGFNSPSAPRIFTLARLGMLFLLPFGYLLISYARGGALPSFVKLYIFGSALALLGLYLPNLYVQARADRRKETIVNGFPDCLDLMLVCIESGLGLEAAIDRVGREMAISYPLIAELLSQTTLQLRAGASREDAFRRLADTAAVDDIRSFTTLLIQSDRLGTSVGSTLRVYAAEMREKRRMRAEEKAHRLPVLISIPLVLFMLPTMIGVVMLPAVIRVVRVVIPMMVGG
ncbi:MAG: type II secretion system F family protein [Novosphingobium sp.]